MDLLWPVLCRGAVKDEICLADWIKFLRGDAPNWESTRDEYIGIHAKKLDSIGTVRFGRKTSIEMQQLSKSAPVLTLPPLGAGRAKKQQARPKKKRPKKKLVLYQPREALYPGNKLATAMQNSLPRPQKRAR